MVIIILRQKTGFIMKRIPLQHFYFGRNNEKIYVNQEGKNYNYHYNFGMNSHRKLARKEQSCDDPAPYYF